MAEQLPDRGSAANDAAGLLLTPSEVQALTGYKRAADQLRALLALGFSRARRSPGGDVILERSHYLAVTTGNRSAEAARPKVRPPKVGRAAA